VLLLPKSIVKQQTVRDLERRLVRTVPAAVKVDAGLPEPALRTVMAIRTGHHSSGLGPIMRQRSAAPANSFVR